MQQVHSDPAHFSPSKERKILLKKKGRQKKIKRQISVWRTLQKERNDECHLEFPAWFICNIHKCVFIQKLCLGSGN